MILAGVYDDTPETEAATILTAEAKAENRSDSEEESRDNRRRILNGIISHYLR
jgi:hypothetical protein